MSSIGGENIVLDGLVLALDAGNIKSFRGEPTTNLLPNPSVNGLPTYGNSWSTYNTNQYGNGSYWSIGTTILDVTDNIVTTTSAHPFRTYDVLNPQTSGGGLVAGTHYFIKKLSTTSFTVHHYNSSQDGSQGYINPATGNHKVYDSIALDQRISVNITDFPLMWHGEAHLPNSGLVKEIIPNGFSLDGYNRSDCIRLHYIRDDNVVDGMAYGADAHVSIGSIHTISFYARSVTPSAVGNTCSCEIYNYNGGFNFGFVLGEVGVWKRYEYQFTPTTSEYCITYWFPPADKFKYDIACIQYEQKDHASAFIGGSRGATVETGGGWKDLSGSANHGDLSNLPTFVSSENGLYFDGSTNIVVNNSTSLIPLVNSWEFVLKPNSLDGYRALFQKSNYNNPSGYISLFMPPNATYWRLNASDVAESTRYIDFIWSTSISPINEVSHVILTYDGSYFRLYVNGISYGSSTIWTYGLGNITEYMLIGDFWGGRWKGYIYSYKIYNRPLTDTEVLQNYNTSKSRFGY